MAFSIVTMFSIHSSRARSGVVTSSLVRNPHSRSFLVSHRTSFVYLSIFTRPPSSSLIIHQQFTIFHERWYIQVCSLGINPSLLLHSSNLPSSPRISPIRSLSILTMSSSTALLPKDRKNDDHVSYPHLSSIILSDICQPIFLRVCHSPWYSISQKCLIAMRSVIAAYMFAGFLSIIDYELNHLHSDWVTAFKFSNVSYGIQLLYQGIAAVSLSPKYRIASANHPQIWPLMHLYYPHHNNEDSYKNTMKKLFSPPKQTAESSSRTWFSIFYSAATTWPIVAAIMHWAVLVPTHHATIPGT